MFTIIIGELDEAIIKEQYSMPYIKLESSKKGLDNFKVLAKQNVPTVYVFEDYLVDGLLDITENLPSTAHLFVSTSNVNKPALFSRADKVIYSDKSTRIINKALEKLDMSKQNDIDYLENIIKMKNTNVPVNILEMMLKQKGLV